MRYKKLWLGLAAMIFFLTALTFYLNQVAFPQWLKKAAVENLQAALKRRVEIGTIRFNWFKGFIVDHVKIYDTDPKAGVFAQADRVSFGIFVVPGLRHVRVTIPFIHVFSPSVHLVHSAKNTWNFSDMAQPSSPPPAQPAAASAGQAPAVPPKVEIAWGGLTITDGQVLIDDASTATPWSELLDKIDLRLSLSTKAISYDLTASIPRKQGSIGADVNYEPLTRNIQAKIRLKNIDTAAYISLIDLPGVHLASGLIEDINLNIAYTQAKTTAEGDVVMKNLDISSSGQAFKGNIDVRGLNAEYRNDSITARGRISLIDVETKAPGFTAAGDVQANVNDFELTKNGQFQFDGDIRAKDLLTRLKDRQIQAQKASLDNLKIKDNAQGLQSSGTIATQGLRLAWTDRNFQGDVVLKDFDLRRRDENNMVLEAGLQADNVRLSASKVQVSAGSIKADKFLADADHGLMKIETVLNASGGNIVLDGHKTIEASPQLELHLQMPAQNPQQLTYQGSITLSGARIEGFEPLPLLDHVGLDVDFQNDAATINAFNADVFNTNVQATGTIKDFKNPRLNITADAADLDLNNLKDLAPRIFEAWGLNLYGTAALKVKFDGLALKPLKADILAVASFKNVTVSAGKLHQQVKNITGIIEATPNSLKWRDTTAVYLGQKYALSGSLDDFKRPEIRAALTGPGLQVKADLTKTGDLVTLNGITGKYFNTAFDTHGTLTLAPGGPAFDLHGHASLLLEDVLKALPAAQKKTMAPLNPSGMINITANVKGSGSDWKDYTSHASLSSPDISVEGYHLKDVKIDADEADAKVKNLTLDGRLYSGTVHAVGSLDLSGRDMPYELALNIDNTDLHELKMDSPLKMQEINGKFFLTTMAHGNIADAKNSLQATGSMAIRDGFLAQFNVFKGLLSVLNDALRLGQVMITDVEGNFTIDNQKINTDNLRLKGPTIVLLTKGWVDFDGICGLDVTVDLSSGVVPAIANDVLSTLNIHIYDRIENPKFKKKISVPQVINSLFKNILQNQSIIPIGR